MNTQSTARPATTIRTSTEKTMHAEITTLEFTTTESLMSTETTPATIKKQRCTREARIARLAARAEKSLCSEVTASLVDVMSAEFEPEAIPALIALLGHAHDRTRSIHRALVRYGESAVDSLCAVADDEPRAARVLEDIAFQSRFLEVGCF